MLQLARRLAAPLAFAALLGASEVAPALVVVTGDDAINKKTPEDDPGWANVGKVSNLTGTYLGKGWVLTAAHVGAGPVVLGGQTFAPVPGSTVTLKNPDGSAADLIVFRIDGDPKLPTLPIATERPEVGAPVVLTGNGRDRGPPFEWSGQSGFTLGGGWAPRWGTNVVFKTGLRSKSTEMFLTMFRKDGASPYESHAAFGDSGGAAFVKSGGEWRLAGVLFGVAGFENQPSDVVLYGNVTLIADLSRYQPQIEEILAKP